MALVGNISGSSQTNSVIGVTGSVIIANRPDAEFPGLPGSDTIFFVSGSTDGTENAVFGGDVVFSGSMAALADTVEITGSLGVLGPIILDGFVTIKNDLSVTGTLKDESGTTRLDLDTGIGTVNVYGSGGSGGNTLVEFTDGGTTILHDGSGGGAGTGNVRLTSIKDSADTNRITLSNPGDVTHYDSAGNTSMIVGTGGLSGSLTKLTDGTSYLVAGNNITIVSQSNGSILISSTGAAPAPTGTSAYTQSFVYGDLTAGVLTVTHNLNKQYVSIAIYDDTGTLIIPDSITATSSTSLDIDLTSFGSFAGTWNLRAVAPDSSPAGYEQSFIDGDLVAGILSVSHGLNEQYVNVVVYNDSNVQVSPDSVTAVSTSAADVDLTSFGTLAGTWNLSVIPAKNSPYGYEQSFTNGDLSGGILTVNHGLGGQYLIVVVYDDTGEQVVPDDIVATSSTSADIDLTSFGSISGTWNISIILSNAVAAGFFISTVAGALYTSGSVAFVGPGAEYGVIQSPADKGSDVFFYVSGSINGSGVDDKKALFGGDVRISGSLSQGFQTIASGTYSHAEGYGTTASGVGSHAEGLSTTASGDYSHAEGYNTTASGDYSHAEGDTTTASGIISHAEGVSTTAAGDGSHAEGLSTTASGSYSHAEGDITTASGDVSHAEGSGTTASGYASHAEGSGTTASGSYSHAEGLGTIASGTYQHVGGIYNKRDNDFSLFIIGDGVGDADIDRNDVFRVNSGRVEVTGSFVSTLGLSGSLTQLSDGTSYLVAGPNVIITSASNGPITISSTDTTGSTLWLDGGNKLLATGSVSIDSSSRFVDSIGSDVFFFVSGSISGSGANDKKAVFGGDVRISGSLAQGYNVRATQQYAVTHGYQTVASGLSGSHAEGYSNTASGQYSHAEGAGSSAPGEGSHAEGLATNSAAQYSHAEGLVCYAGGVYSHAEGYGTATRDSYSHAEGLGANAWAQYSHAEGSYTEARAVGSHTEGSGSITKGSHSHAEGLVTIASGAYQHVQGKYNKRGNDFSLFVIGDGIGDADADRSDIIRVNSGSTPGFGQLQVTGSISVSGSYLLNVVSGTSNPTYNVGSWEHVVVFTTNNVTGVLPASAPVGAQIIFKEGTGLATVSGSQMLSSSAGRIDGSATFTMPSINYTSVAVIKIKTSPEEWIIV